MKTGHRYILEPYKGMKTRYRCPSCQQRVKTFSLYIDTETGKHIHPSVGRCDRESNCGYHYTPKQFFQDHNISFDKPQPKTFKPWPVAPVTPQPKPVSFIHVDVFKQTLQGEKNIKEVAKTNHFVKFLIDLFGVVVAGQLVSRYFIATSKHWNGATVFWQIDTQGKVRTGKIMLYNPITGKRVKDLEPSFYWAHKALKQPGFELRQCLFGEHLLKIDKTKPVAIVESEKTAVIASVYLPQFIWVAVGGLNNLNAEKCSVLKGRRVALFPDLNGFEKWSHKAKELSHLAIFTVSDLLERNASEAERKQGFDLADYLIKFNCKDFELPEPEATQTPPGSVQTFVEANALDKPKPPKPDPDSWKNSDLAKLFKEQALNNSSKPKPPKPDPDSWKQDILEIESLLKGVTLPTQPIKLNNHSTITNIPYFIESNLALAKESGGNKNLLLPYLTRLRELASILKVLIKGGRGV